MSLEFETQATFKTGVKMYDELNIYDENMNLKQSEVDDLDTIIKHFGVKHQIVEKTVEELKELIDEIQAGSPETIFEETCDVILMIFQLQRIYGWTDKEIQEQIASKKERTLERIKSGYYENRNN